MCIHPKLKFKAVKCAHLSFCNRDPPIEASYTINKSTLNKKLVHKGLGVISLHVVLKGLYLI